MEIEERLIPVAAEAGPRGELTDEKETRMDQRITKVQGSQSEGLTVDSACNPYEERNKLASAMESQQVRDPSLGGVTGGLVELGPGLTHSPSLSAVGRADVMPELRHEELTVTARNPEGFRDRSEEDESAAINQEVVQGEILSQ